MKLFLPLLALSGLSASISWSAVLYSSNSDWNVSTNTNLSNAKWYAAGGRNNFYSVVNTDGIPGNDNSSQRRGGISNGADSSGTLNDYLYFQNNNTTTTNFDYFAHTAEGSSFVPFVPNSYSTLTASWLVNRDDFASGGGYYMAVQVANGAWYASTTNAANQTALGTVWIDLLVSEWVLITENPIEGASGSLLLGTTKSTYAQLFSSGQQITGVGFFADNLSAVSGTSRTLRIDNFTIQDVIPEPSTAFSGTIAAGLFLLRRRR
jgi:hypothetical protein